MSTCCPWDEMGVATLSNRFANVVNTINFYSSKDEVVEIGDGSLMVRPFFRDFRDRGIYGEDGSAFVRTNAFVRWYALSHGIPAESFAAGANPVPKWGIADAGEDLSQSTQYQHIGNVNMATDCNSAGPGAAPLNWIHSYFIQMSTRVSGLRGLSLTPVRTIRILSLGRILRVAAEYLALGA